MNRSSQPSLVHPLLGAGPAAELLAVVGQHREPVAGAAELAQVVGGLLRRAERNEVAEPLVDGEERHPLAVALGPERGVQLLGGEAGDEEVAVVDQRVAHAGVGQVGGELRLPDPLGEPEPARVDAEAAAHRLVHPVDLLDPVGAGQRGEHRLVEAGQQELDPAVGGQAAEPVEIGRLVAPRATRAAAR